MKWVYGYEEACGVEREREYTKKGIRVERDRTCRGWPSIWHPICMGMMETVKMKDSHVW